MAGSGWGKGSNGKGAAKSRRTTKYTDKYLENLISGGWDELEWLPF